MIKNVKSRRQPAIREDFCTWKAAEDGAWARVSGAIVVLQIFCNLGINLLTHCILKRTKVSYLWLMRWVDSYKVSSSFELTFGKPNLTLHHLLLASSICKIFSLCFHIQLGAQVLFDFFFLSSILSSTFTAYHSEWSPSSSSLFFSRFLHGLCF